MRMSVTIPTTIPISNDTIRSPYSSCSCRLVTKPRKLAVDPTRPSAIDLWVAPVNIAVNHFVGMTIGFATGTMTSSPLSFWLTVPNWVSADHGPKPAHEARAKHAIAASVFIWRRRL